VNLAKPVKVKHDFSHYVTFVNTHTGEQSCAIAGCKWRRRATRRKPIARTSARIKRAVPVARRSPRRSRVERMDAAWGQVVLTRHGWQCELGIGERQEAVRPIPDVLRLHVHPRCSRQATDPHHVRGKKAHPELRHDPANGIALCRPHHEKAHAHPAAFKAWFARYRPEDWQAIA
jgi:hypothetical protein